MMTPSHEQMMGEPSLSDVPGWVWERAVTAHHRLLMLDYDGTLAPFQVDRENAFLSRPLLALLVRIAESRSTSMAVVSGRPAAELVRFLGSLRIHLVGEHGWESRLPDGRVIQHPLSTIAKRSLEWASMVLCREPWASRIEPKSTSLLLHTTGLTRDEALRIESRCERLWAPVIADGSLRLSHVTRGIELRAIGRDKGIAVRELIADSLPGTFLAYIGDDETDE